MYENIFDRFNLKYFIYFVLKIFCIFVEQKEQKTYAGCLKSFHVVLRVWCVVLIYSEVIMQKRRASSDLQRKR